MRSFLSLFWVLPIISVLAVKDSNPVVTVSAFQSNGQQCYVVRQPVTSITSTTLSSSVSVTTTSDTTTATTTTTDATTSTTSISIDSSSSDILSTSTTSSSSSSEIATTSSTTTFTTTSATTSTDSTTSLTTTSTTTSVAAPTFSCFAYVAQDSSATPNVLTLSLVTSGQGTCNDGYLFVSDITGTFNTISVFPNTGTNYGGADNCISLTSPYIDDSGLGFADDYGHIYNYYTQSAHAKSLIQFDSSSGDFSYPAGTFSDVQFIGVICADSTSTTSTTSSSDSISTTTTSIEETPTI